MSGVSKRYNANDRPRAVVPSSLALTAALAVGFVASAAMAQTPIPPSAPDFAMAAAQSDQYEIQAARDAITQSQNPQIRAFAQQMIADHTRTSDSLRRAALASGLPAPAQAMSSDQATMLSALQGLRGADFDKAYAKQQVLAHTQALAVEQSYASAGMNPNLQAVARSGAPLIQHHLEMARQIHDALGGS
jgi:putative membrane protein